MESRSRVKSYMEQEISGLSNAELLRLLYDAGLRACRQRDRQRAIGVLVELMGSIDISHGEIATGLLRLYDYAVREVRENRFEFAETLMSDLGQSYRETVGDAVSLPRAA